MASYFSIDSRLKRSVIPFLCKPGIVARAYVEGKRQLYLHPSQAYVVASVIFFFFFSIYTKSWKVAELSPENLKFDLGTEGDSLLNAKVDSLVTLQELDSLQVEEIDSVRKVIMNNTFIHELDSLIAVDKTNEEILEELKVSKGKVGAFFAGKMLDIYRNKGSGLLSTALAQIPLAIFLLIPVYALMLWLLHLRRKKTLVENLVHSMYLFSFLYLLATQVLILIWITGWTKWLYLFLIIPPIYFLISYMRFYQQGFFKAGIKLGLISLLFTTLTVPVAILLTMLLTFLFYSG